MEKRMGERSYRAVIIGGGASGMAAAIAAAVAALEAAGVQDTHKAAPEADGEIEKARENRNVLLLESNDRVGKKILATGNGKCNFTHENISTAHYNTDDQAVLKAVLTGFPTQAALEFFENLGMLAREKNGYYYPLSETASTVLNVLRLRLSELGCEIVCGVRVEKVEKTGDGFFVTYRDAEKEYKVYADSLILATGSKAGGFLQDKREDPLRLARDLGLHSTPLYPALTKCVCLESRYYRQLAGVRAQVKLNLYAERRAADSRESCLDREKLWKNKTEGPGKRAEIVENPELLRQEAGELQLTKEGISGIAVFQLSGEIAQKLAEGRRVFVEINFLPDFPEDSLEDWVKKCLFALPGRSLEEFFLGVLHKKVLDVCLQAEGLKGATLVMCESSAGNHGGMPAGKEAYRMVLSVVKRAMHFTTEVTGVSDIEQAQVCRGGLLLSQFDGKLECKTVPGLFACGEVLNVDGACGGYNLHFAWASGVLAGRGAAMRGGHHASH